MTKTLKGKGMKWFLDMMIYAQFQLHDGISLRALRARPTKLLMVHHRWRGKGDKMNEFHIHSSGLVEERQIRVHVPSV